MTTSVKSRADQRMEDQWQLADLFPSIESWEAEFAAVKSNLVDMAAFKGKLGDPAVLKSCFELEDRMGLAMERLYVFANMWHHEDTALPEPQGYADRTKKLSAEVGESMSFISPELLALDDVQLQALVQHESLSFYRQTLLDIQRLKPHVLSDAEEALLAQVSQVGQAAGTIFGMMNNADMQFPEIEDAEGNRVRLTHGNYIQFLESPNRDVRRRAFEAMYQTYHSFRNTFASTLSANTTKNVFYAKARNYESPLDQALFAYEIPHTVYTNLIAAMNEHLPLLHRYFALRKRLLKADELHMYDLFVPLVDAVDWKIDYAEAKSRVLKSLQPLGETYIDVLKQSFEQRWIDVYENQGKRSGAYSWGAFGTHPYVLLNHKDNLNSMFTLTHEMGHALHSYFSDQTQAYRYAQYTIFNAEVASTLNEALLMHDLLAHATDDKDRLYLLTYYADQFRTTVYRQTMFAEFEMIIHQKAQDGEPLTAQVLSEIYYDLVKRFHGPEMVVDQAIEMEWARIPHFYSSFYVYQYATGFSAATSLASQILEEGQPAVDRYLGFLKSGGSADSITLLKQAGVDMSSPEPVRQALAVFQDVLDQMEAVIARMESPTT
jgi:oligoendopeptidase F